MLHVFIFMYKVSHTRSCLKRKKERKKKRKKKKQKDKKKAGKEKEKQPCDFIFTHQ